MNRIPMLNYSGLAMPSARAAAASRWGLLRVSSIASITIAVFAAAWFTAHLISAAGQL